MTLKLAIEITGDQRGFKAAATETGRDLDQIVAKAKVSAAELARLEAELEQAAGAAARMTNASVNSAGRINERLGVRTDFGGAQRGEDVAAFGRELDAVRAKYNPVFAAQQQYLGQLREIREAQRLGALSADEATAAITRTKNAFAAQVRDQRTVARGGMPAWQRANLTAQGLDVATSLIGGMNPLMIAAQQGPQVVQAYGGVKETIEGVRAAVTATRVAVLGVTGAVVAGALAWNSYLNSVKEVETAASGLGRGSGATASELGLIAERGAAAGGISEREARSIEAVLLRTGKIGADAFQPLITMSKDFAATIGTDLAGAGEQLAAMFADPAKGAETLYQKYGLISGAQSRYVQQLARQGEADKARLALIEALNGRLVDAEKATTALGRAWDAVANAASNAAQAIGEAIERRVSGETPEQELARLKQERDGPGGFDPTLDLDLFGDRDRRIKELEAQVAAEKQAAAAERQRKLDEAKGTFAIGLADRSPVNELDRRRRELQTEIGNLEAGQGKPGVTAEENDRIARSIEAKRAALEGLRPAYERQIQIEQLDAQISQARDPVTKADLAARRERIALAQEEIGPAERAARIEAARTQSLNASLATARTATADMRDEAQERARVNAAVAAGSASLDELEARLRLELSLRPRIIALANAEGSAREDLARSIREERAAFEANRAEQARSAGLRILSGQGDELARARTEQALIGDTNGELERRIALLRADQQIRQAGLATGSAEAKQIRDNAAALAELNIETERRQAVYRMSSGQREEMERLRLEEALIGSSNAERTRAIALLDAEQRIRDAGVASSSAEAEAIRANARAIAEVSTELERKKAAYAEVEAFGERSIDRVTDKIREQGLSFKTLGSAATDMAKDLEAEFFKLAVANPAKNMLLGQNNPTLSDAGGALQRLFGGGQSSAEAKVADAVKSAATMTVTAGTVIVTGAAGVPSLTGAGGGLPALAMRAGVPQIPGTTADGIYLPKHTGLTAPAAAAARANEAAAGPWSAIRTSGTANVSSLNPVFKDRLGAMFAAAPPDIADDLSVYSGYRSTSHQARLYALDIARNGGRPSGMVGRPGGSMHQYGEAADLRFTSPEARSWVHENAGQYGLRFPMNDPRRHPYEPWHIEPVGGRRQGGTLAPAAPPEVNVAPAQASIDRLTQSTNQAAQGALPQLTQQTQAATQGLDGFGQGLLKALQGGGGAPAGGGAGGGIFSWLFGTGGATGGAGATAAPVPTAPAVAAAPAIAAAAAPAAGARSGNFSFTVLNQGRPVTGQVVEDREDENGRHVTALLGEAQAAEIDRAGSQTNKALARRYGLTDAPYGRGA
ncbi:phage tail length tape measure family protein [Hansschlegelia zhihuaiae]|uniref:Peptidase M15B domain-containing protein n=1 Tax=Hansschlegelia zhihuaiae TaxID=405005 RepID=A0A4Q0MN89_9HYPH|nr:phage tail length tape measure family protein [Hansschlegelia zhihuaiae]RXF75083.1 hypothetical protein EK403_03275 [Hansschlegelia zhihuaiae]